MLIHITVTVHTNPAHSTVIKRASLVHSPFPAILDDDLTSQLAWTDSRCLPPVCEYVIACPSWICLCTSFCSLPYPRASDGNEKQSSEPHNAEGNSTKAFYTKHLLNLGCTHSPSVHCILLVKAYLCFPYQVKFLKMTFLKFHFSL